MKCSIDPSYCPREAAKRVCTACETCHASGHTRMPESLCLYRGPGTRAELYSYWKYRNQLYSRLIIGNTWIRFQTPSGIHIYPLIPGAGFSSNNARICEQTEISLTAPGGGGGALLFEYHPR